MAGPLRLFAGSQEGQSDALKSIESSFKTHLKIMDRLDKRSHNAEYAVNAIAEAAENMAKDLGSITKDLTGNSEKFYASMQGAKDHADSFISVLDGAGDAADNLGDNMSSAGDKAKDFASTLSSVSKTIARVFDAVGKEVDKFSEASNKMLQQTGMSGDAVRDFRSDFLGIVSDLNRTTGSYYSPTESYNKIIAMSEGVTSNLEAIQEMSRPLLLADESMNIDIHNVAELFNKFYTRYSFSSLSMEETLDEIRGNTANNAADEKITLENIKSLEGWIGQIAGDDESKRKEMMKDISHYTSWLESMDIDSGPFTEYLKVIAGGRFSENPEVLNLLTKGGISSGTAAHQMFREGQFEEITEALMEGIVSTYRNTGIKGSMVEDIALKNLGLDPDTVRNIDNAFASKNYKGLDEFIKNVKSSDPSSMEDVVEDKYVSAAKKANNWLEQIYGKLAGWQEAWGIGFTDIALIFSGIASILSMSSFSKGVNSLLGKSGGTGSLLGSSSGGSLLGSFSGGGRPTTGLLGSLEMRGFNASGGSLVGGKAALAGAGTLAGVAAGAALTVDGFKGLIDKENSGFEKGASAVELGAGAAGAGLLLASNPIGWAVLAAGGVAYLAKAAYENAHELSGNAKIVQQELDDIGKSLQDENKKRLEDISNLSYHFNQADTIEEKRELIEQSGLISKEKLNSTADENLQKLIDEYKSAAVAMSQVTDGVLGTAERYYTEQQDIQQQDFLETLFNDNLSGKYSDQQRTDIINMLKSGVTDEDLLTKIESKLKDGKITSREFEDLLNGGANAWFDKNNLLDKGLSVDSMRIVSGYLGYDQNFIDTANMQSIVKLMNSLQSAIARGDQSLVDTAWQAIIDSGLKDELKQVYGDTLSPLVSTWNLQGYAEGSNYIPHDQLALIHEGEAVVPKKYNPAVNNAQYARLAAQLKDSQDESIKEAQETRGYMQVFVDEMRELRSFLSTWKSDSEKNETIKEAKSKFSSSRENVLNYMA